MTLPILLRAGVIWLLILCFAIANGALREVVLIPRLGAPWALILSGVLLAACVFVAAWLFVRGITPLTTHQYLVLGMIWLTMTLIFEFGFGLLRHKSWPEMLSAYQFHDGNLWPLVLLVIVLSPWLAGMWQAREP